jgi:ABC-2 type transport system permease protein
VTRTLLTITALQLFGRRRVILIGLLALLPLGIAVLSRFAGDSPDDPTPAEFATFVLDALVVVGLLPIGALIFGTAALGAEIEDGTAVYLLSKPIARWRILLVKVAVASLATIALATPTTVLTALVILGGEDPEGIAAGFALGVTVGAIAYCCVFVGLSAITSRALLIGLGYVFVWEAFVTSIFSGTRWVSVRQYVLGLADSVSTTPASAFEAELGGTGAAVASAVVILASLAIGIRFLERFEIGERL